MDITANQLFEEAIEQLRNMLSGERFIAKDLFRGYMWNRFL